MKKQLESLAGTSWNDRRMGMQIDKLYLNDFRGIHKLELDLDGKSTVLFGINGVGKSSILAAINLLYAGIINRLVKQRFKQAIKMETSDIKYGKTFARVKADFRFDDEKMIYPYSRMADRKGNKYHDAKQLDGIVAHFEQLYLPESGMDMGNNTTPLESVRNIPIFVNYGVNRLVLKTPLRIRKTENYGQFNAFEKAIENQIAFSKLFEWFLEQEIYEITQQRIDPKYVDVQLRAVKNAMLAMLDGYRDIYITARPYSMKVYKGDEVLDILQLSDGEKCTLALFGDLARRLAIANPLMENPLEGKGVVLIDEIELHMHTSWQRKVIAVLKQTFPNIQFIITTHSPQVLGEINDDYNVFALYRQDNDIACDAMSAFFGLDANTVLEDAFKTDSLDARIKEKVQKMYEYIESRDFNQAEKVISEIDELTMNRNVDTTRGKVLIRKGKK